MLTFNGVRMQQIDVPWLWPNGKWSWWCCYSFKRNAYNYSRWKM